MKKKKNIIIIFLIVLSVPIVITFGMNMEIMRFASGDANGWLGFWGGYIGAIVGGLVAYYIAKLQIDMEKKVRVEEKNDKDNFVGNIIQFFLYEEMRRNIENIDSDLISSLERRSKDKNSKMPPVVYKKFCFNEYNEIKFLILGYDSDKVRETAEIYNIFKTFSLADAIFLKNISEKKALRYYNSIMKWKNRLEID